jgi:protein-S-isoprenylcysteine O-methyltransferase Ste14
MTIFFVSALRLGGPALITAWQIKPEEAALSQTFGDGYDAYRKRVRRWL